MTTEIELEDLENILTQQIQDIKQNDAEKQQENEKLNDFSAETAVLNMKSGLSVEEIEASIENASHASILNKEFIESHSIDDRRLTHETTYEIPPDYQNGDSVTINEDSLITALKTTQVNEKTDDNCNRVTNEATIVITEEITNDPSLKNLQNYEEIVLQVEGISPVIEDRFQVDNICDANATAITSNNIQVVEIQKSDQLDERISMNLNLTSNNNCEALLATNSKDINAEGSEKQQNGEVEERKSLHSSIANVSEDVVVETQHNENNAEESCVSLEKGKNDINYLQDRVVENIEKLKINKEREEVIQKSNEVDISPSGVKPPPRPPRKNSTTQNPPSANNTNATTDNIDTLISMIGEATFEDYVENHFNFERKGMFKSKTTPDKLGHWKSDLIKAPLLRLEDATAQKEALQLFKNVTGYMGRKSSKGSDEHLQKIFSILQKSSEELRDEFYCQICKQTNHNPSTDSTIEGWELMTICLTLYPPSFVLLKPLMAYCRSNISNASPEISKFATMCLKKCPNIMLAGKNSVIPTIEQVGCIKLGKLDVGDL